jgi:hypothetical protein
MCSAEEQEKKAWISSFGSSSCLLNVEKLSSTVLSETLNVTKIQSEKGKWKRCRQTGFCSQLPVSDDDE